MHSTSFRMSVSIIVILSVFCKAHFKSLRIHDTTENLPLAALYERMTIKSFLPDHKIFLIFPKEALLFSFIFLCFYALIAFPVYS